MLKRMILMLICLATYCFGSTAFAATSESTLDLEIQNDITDLDLEEWQTTIDSLDPEIRTLLHDNIEQQLTDTAMHGLKWYGADLAGILRTAAVSKLKTQTAFLSTIIGLALAGGVVKAFSVNNKNRLNEIIIFIFYCFVSCIAIAKFSKAVSVGQDAVNSISRFIEAASPLLILLLNTVGSVSANGIIQPSMALLTGSVTMVIKNIAIPLILIGGVLSVLNHFTGRTQLQQLSNLTKSGTKWVLGLMFTLYTGVIILQGLSTKAIDGLSVRTAKFAADRFIPVVGGMISGTMDTALWCAILIKNAVGTTAILITALISAMPLIGIGVDLFAFRIAAALCEPISDPRVPKLFATIADMLGMLFSVIAVLCVMFIITVGIAIGMNGSVGGI